MAIIPMLCKQSFRFHLASQMRKVSSQELFEIGHFDDPKLVTNYRSGQTFVHKLLGYRGLVIFPWITQVYNKSSKKTDQTSQNEKMWKEDHKQSYYYQVFIDCRDIPFTNIRSDPIPLLMRMEKTLLPLPDGDFAAHDDILPYTMTQKQKFQHELLEHFFHYRPETDFCYEPRDELKLWQEKSSERLGLTDVYVEESKNIRVTVMPFFIGLRKTRRFVRFFWRYTVRLENLSDTPVKVKGYKLRMFCSEGLSVYKTSRKITGIEPVLNKSLPIFQYNSFASLRSPCGHVRGFLEMQRKDGSSFQCNVPMFMLQSGEIC